MLELTIQELIVGHTIKTHIDKNIVVPQCPKEEKKDILKATEYTIYIPKRVLCKKLVRPSFH